MRIRNRMKNSLVAIFLIFSITSGLEISSKIDFESEEKCSNSSSNSADPIILLIKNEPDGSDKMRNFHSSGPRFFIGENPNFRGFGRSPRPQNNHNPTSRRKVTRTINIVVNGMDIVSSIPGSVICNEEYCETTVITRIDDEGNPIDVVKVKVLAKAKIFKVDDVPVIEGVWASGYDDNRNTPDTFLRENRRFNSQPHFIDNDISQRQAPRHNLPGSQSASFNPRNFGPGRQSWRPWKPTIPPIDDKIEPPLSKTDHVVQ